MECYNPATGELIWRGTAANQDEVNTAFETASKAFKSWSVLPFSERIEYVQQFKQHLSDRSNELAEAISKQTGKPLWESKSEVSAVINKVDISIGAYELRCAELKQQIGAQISTTRHKPHGIVAVFGPYNFPAHLPNGHIIPALIAGNTVVFKPSELGALVGELMTLYWTESGLPSGVINLIQGGPETGKLITKHHLLNGIFFTGSWPTGKILLEQFASQPEKILALEMGGNNPLVFHETENVDAAAYITLQSAYLSAGQRCTCARRLIVIDGKQSEKFIDTLGEYIKGIRIGPYTETPEPYMGPLITEQAANKIVDAQNLLLRMGGKPICKMQLLKKGTGFVTPGLIDVTNVLNRPDEEYFGPLLQLIRVPSFENAIHEANHTQYGLAAGLLSDNPKAYEKFYQGVKAGVINWNTQLTGASSAAAFGGIGHSGNFRPSALYAADYCSYPVASMEMEKMSMPATLNPGLMKPRSL